MFKQQLLINHIVKRFKVNKIQFPHELKKKSNTQKALQHFDDFYKSVFDHRWPGIRAALLTEHKYVALVNNFADTEKTKEALELKGAINIRLIYEAFSEETATPDQHSNINDFNNPNLDDKITNVLEKTKTSEIKSIYQQHAEEGLEKLLLEKTANKSRVIETDAVVNYKKSLEKTLEEDSDFDYNRMISAEIGANGLQEFIPATKLKGMEDYVTESEHYQYYSTTVDFPLKFEVENDFKFPATLNLYAYPKSDISRFSRPKRDNTNTFNHFLMDGASILPPLMLNLQAGDRVFDACAAPGGKSLLMLQTMLPDVVVCNDMMKSRTNRIHSLFEQYLNDFEEKWLDSRCLITQQDARNCTELSTYDKILVDVPCTNDRLSVSEDENNMFKSNRVKERLRIPEIQSQILIQCLQLLKPGGSLVYSTCSLSPVQNDGVVHMALSRAFSEFHITATIKDLSQVLRPLQSIFHFENPKELKYGQLVLPYLPANFGPMYFCKITRNDVGK